MLIWISYKRSFITLKHKISFYTLSLTLVFEIVSFGVKTFGLFSRRHPRGLSGSVAMNEFLKGREKILKGRKKENSKISEFATLKKPDFVGSFKCSWCPGDLIWVFWIAHLKSLFLEEKED